METNVNVMVLKMGAPFSVEKGYLSMLSPNFHDLYHFVVKFTECFSFCGFKALGFMLRQVLILDLKQDTVYD